MLARVRSGGLAAPEISGVDGTQMRGAPGTTQRPSSKSRVLRPFSRPCSSPQPPSCDPPRLQEEHHIPVAVGLLLPVPGVKQNNTKYSGSIDTRPQSIEFQAIAELAKTPFLWSGTWRLSRARARRSQPPESRGSMATEGARRSSVRQPGEAQAEPLGDFVADVHPDQQSRDTLHDPRVGERPPVQSP